MDLSKFKDLSKKLNISEATVYLLKILSAKIADLESSLSKINQHLCMTCGHYTTSGGAVTEVILDSAVKPNMHALVQMSELGTTPVSIVSAKCLMGQILVTFSSDPGDDHELNYHVCK